MPFTIVHGLISYFAVCKLTKDGRLRALAFVAGMLPDLDGIPLLFDMNLYRVLHRELFHQPIYGLILGIPIALIFGKYYGMDRKKTFAVFSGSFILHSVTDVLFTDWPVKLLWPFSQQQFVIPVFYDYNWLLALGLAAILVGQRMLRVTSSHA